MSNLYANAKPAEELASNSGNKFLSQGVHAMTVAGVGLYKAPGGNQAISIVFDTGFETKDKEKGIMVKEFKNKRYFLLDKNNHAVIDEKAWLRLRDALFGSWGIVLEQVSAIRDANADAHMLPQLATTLNGLLRGRQNAVTVEYGDQPSSSTGKYYLELNWINPIDQLESRQSKFVAKPNPNKGTSSPQGNAYGAVPATPTDGQGFVQQGYAQPAQQAYGTAPAYGAPAQQSPPAQQGYAGNVAPQQQNFAAMPDDELPF